MKYILGFFYLIIGFASLFVISHFLEKDDDKNKMFDYISEFEGTNIEDLQELQQQDNTALHLSLVNINIEQGSEGKKSWELYAKWAAYADSTGNLQLRDSYITYWNTEKEEEPPLYIEGKIGLVLDNNSYISLKEDVKLRQDTMTLTGNKLEFKVDDNLFTVYENVKLEKEDIIITSDNLEFKANDNIITLNDNVFLTAPDAIGKAQHLLWDAEKNSMQADDNVVFIFNNDNTTYSLD